MTDGWPLYESRLKRKLHVISKRYTQRIERHNLNLRQHLARLGRKLLSFSKSVELHDKVIGHYLNNQNQLIAGETLFTGTINRTEVHPREVIKRALYHNAAAVVLAHNHPSGEVTPSKADRLITERLVQALGLVDIRVPDHLIVGGSQVFSFAEYGLL
ncbi:hypothetical protein HZ878_003824 [Escherichia coli]|nr:hypothetical protein [Escherichia coli]